MNWLRYLFASRFRRAGLFRYWDGRRTRYADGYRLWRAYVADPFFSDQETLENLAALGTRRYDADDGQAQRDMALLDRFFEELAKVFSVRRFDPDTGRGLTDTELAALFCRFEQWIMQKKTPDALLPIWWPTAGKESSPSATPPPTSESASSSTLSASP